MSFNANHELCEKLGFNGKKRKTNNEIKTIDFRAIFANAFLCFLTTFALFNFPAFLKP